MIWHLPVGDPTKLGMCRHYNDPKACEACRIHEQEMAHIRDRPLVREKP